MQTKKKIILFEGELKKGKGHHYDHMVENSLFYKDRGEIFWVVNKKFKKAELFIPDFVKVLNIIDSSERKIVFKNLASSFEKIYYAVKNFFKSYFFLFYYLNLNRNFINFIFNNFFCFPKYFSSFYNVFRKIHLKKNDKLIFQTSRINDLELAYLLILLKFEVQIHMRIIQLHRKKKLKKFNYILKKLDQENQLKKNIFIYSETEFQKQEIKRLTNLDIELFFNNLSFSKKNNSYNKLNIGILGESREDKGFYKIPELIKNLNNKVFAKVNFIIQINNCPKSLFKVKDELIELEKKFKNICLLYGYIDFYRYREILRSINIIPLLHELDQLKNCGSGIVFSSIVNEIPIVIPKKAIFVKKFFEYKSFLEAQNDNDYSNKIIEIINNYPKFLEMAKKQSRLYEEKLNQDFLNNRI